MVIVRAHSQPHSPPHKHTHTQSHTRTMSRFAHLQCDHIANFHNFSAIGFYSNVVFLVSFLIFVARKISSFLGRSTLADADAFVCELVSHWSTIPIVLYLSHTLSTHFSNFKNLLSLSLTVVTCFLLSRKKKSQLFSSLTLSETQFFCGRAI